MTSDDFYCVQILPPLFFEFRSWDLGDLLEWDGAIGTIFLSLCFFLPFSAYTT